MISEPEIRFHEILGGDEFFVLGTQSLWEHLGPEEVIEIIKENEFKDYGTCSDIIYQKAKDSAITEG